MGSHSNIFAHTSVKVCLALKRVSLFRFPILSFFFQFVTITDNKDVHYYLFNGERLPQQKELAQMVEYSLCMQEVLEAIPRF